MLDRPRSVQVFMSSSSDAVSMNPDATSRMVDASAPSSG
jgi:hypothetical protein